MDVLASLSDSPDGRTSAELAKSCGISTSTCALVLAELQRRNWVTRRDDRRYTLGSGLVRAGPRLENAVPAAGPRPRDTQLPAHHAGRGLLDVEDQPEAPHYVDAVGHGTDGEHAVGQRFPIGPPFGLVAMAWREEDAIDAWLRRVTPRLTDADIAGHRRVLAGIRDRGYGAWRFDAAHTHCTTGSPRCWRRWSPPRRYVESSAP